MSQSVICFYHKHCIDGTAAAAVVQSRFPGAVAVPVGFDSAEQDMAVALATVVDDTLIIFVDNSMRLAEVLTLNTDVLVIDHHISEFERNQKLAAEHPRLTYVFDNNFSGATLAFKYFYPDEAIPLLLQYVQDIDLFTNKFLPESEKVALYLSQYRDDPIAFLRFLKSGLEEIVERGGILLEYVEKEVSELCALTPIMFETTVGKVPAYNITNHQSKAGNLLSAAAGSAVILFKINGAVVRCSIRSQAGQEPSALRVAQSLGGGGHECVAGASVPSTEFFSSLVI
jgi:uncharacterized protein